MDRSGDTPEERGYVPGSREDFDRLYRRAYPRVLRTAYGVLGDAAAAEDCVQEAFVRAFEAWARFRPVRRAEVWLQRIVVNVCISEHRRRRRRSLSETLRRLGRPLPDPDPADEASGGDIVAALSSLPPRLSATFVLRHYHGYGIREIAVAAGISERAVGMRLADAARRLRRRLGPGWLADVETSDSGRLER